MFADDEINILVIVLDVNPIWWGQQAQREPQVLSVLYNVILTLIHNIFPHDYDFFFKFTLSTCLDSLMVLANAHLVMSRTNKLAVIANLYQKR